MAAVLGVATPLYLPFALFNIASPLITMLLGFTGFRIEPVSKPRHRKPAPRKWRGPNSAAGTAS
jgi:NhaC family Na+:H+ antiporter